MKNIRLILASIGLLAAVVVGAVVPKGASASVVYDQKVTICHRTNSVKNRYVKITVDKSAVDGSGQNDHSHHTGPVATSEQVAQQLKDNKTKWGDIIPDATSGGVGTGLNWDTDGMAVYNNNCGNGDQVPPTEVVPNAVTFTDPTCNTSGSYTVPTTVGVDYKVNGQVVSAGTYTAQNGSTVTVDAEADQSHFVADGTTDSWTHTFTTPSGCGGQVLGAQVTTTPTGGVNAGAGGAAKASPAASVGFVGSIVAIALGLALRRKWTV